jgi:hypothetical protein
VLNLLVLTTDDTQPILIDTADTDPTDSFASLQGQTLVDGATGDDGVAPDFQWVDRGYDGDNNHARGWEASAVVQSGNYADLYVQTRVLANNRDVTSSLLGQGEALELKCSVAIGNIVWHDINMNSIMDGGESGIANITVMLYQDSNGNGVCEYDDSDGAAVSSTTTDSSGMYQFLDLPPSDVGDPTTYYCVAVRTSDLAAQGYEWSSAGGGHDPDLAGDQSASEGDDGVPAGDYVVSQPFAPTAGGQSDLSDTGDPAGFADESAFMTVDFGFFSQADAADDPPNAVVLSGMQVQFGDVSPWLGLAAVVGLAGAGGFLWRRRR